MLHLKYSCHFSLSHFSPVFKFLSCRTFYNFEVRVYFCLFCKFSGWSGYSWTIIIVRDDVYCFVVTARNMLGPLGHVSVAACTKTQEGLRRTLWIVLIRVVGWRLVISLFVATGHVWFVDGVFHSPVPEGCSVVPPFSHIRIQVSCWIWQGAYL